MLYTFFPRSPQVLTLVLTRPLTRTLTSICTRDIHQRVRYIQNSYTHPGYTLLWTQRRLTPLPIQVHDKKMSSSAIPSSLPDHIQALLRAFIASIPSTSSSDQGPLSGSTEQDQAEITTWIGRVPNLAGAVSDQELSDLDKTLSTKTYLVGNFLTLADVAVYGALWSTIVRPVI